MDAQTLLSAVEPDDTLYLQYVRLGESSSPVERAVAAHWRSLLGILELYPEAGVAEALLHATAEQLVFLGRQV